MRQHHRIPTSAVLLIVACGTVVVQARSEPRAQVTGVPSEQASEMPSDEDLWRDYVEKSGLRDAPVVESIECRSSAGNLEGAGSNFIPVRWEEILAWKRPSLVRVEGRIPRVDAEGYEGLYGFRYALHGTSVSGSWTGVEYSEAPVFPAWHPNRGILWPDHSLWIAVLPISETEPPFEGRGLEDVCGTSTYLVRRSFAPSGGAAEEPEAAWVELNLDVEELRPIRARTSWAPESEVFFWDFVSLQGLRLPRARLVMNEGREWFVATSECSINPDLEDSYFDAPRP